MWSAWATDVVPGDDRMVLVSPIATKDGKAITGKVAYELIVDEPADQPQFVGRLGTAYPFASDGAPDAALTERDRPDGERRVVARARFPRPHLRHHRRPTTFPQREARLVAEQKFAARIRGLVRYDVIVERTCLEHQWTDVFYD